MRKFAAGFIACFVFNAVCCAADLPQCKVLDVKAIGTIFSNAGHILQSHTAEMPSVPCPANQTIVGVSGCSYCTLTEIIACLGSSVTSLPSPSELPAIVSALHVSASLIQIIYKRAFYGKYIGEIHIEENHLALINQDAFEGVEGVRYLSLAKNGLCILIPQMFYHLKELQTLILDDNNLELNEGYFEDHNIISEKYLTKLERMSFQNNPIKVLPSNSFKWLKNSQLSYLSLKGTKIVSVHQKSFQSIKKSLKELELADSANVENIIYNITTGLEGGVIEYLGLSSTGLMQIPKDALNLVSPTLLGLALQGNTFHRLDSSSFPPLPSLVTLDLRRCAILTLADGAFNGLKSLTNLYLSGNRLKIISKPFNVLNNLQFLDLSNNPDPILSTESAVYNIRKGTFKGLEKLEVLNLAHSRVKFIDKNVFEDTPNLSTLSLCDTYINLETEFLHYLPNLVLLDLSNNDNFDFKPELFKGLSKLRSLRLINCEIESFEEDVDYFEHMTNLTELYMSHNKISIIPRTMFRSLPHLRSLFLENNLIDSWTTAIFENNTELIQIYIDNNQICYLTNETTSELLKMRHISFEYNPLICDCNLHSFIRQLTDSDIKVNHWMENLNGYTCYDPSLKLDFLINRLPAMNCSRTSAPSVPEDQIDNLVAIVSSASVGAICIVIMATSIVLYKKRKNLRFFGIMVKNAISVALQEDDKEDQEIIYIYDVFVSYCDSDRDWVIQKLLPSLERENQLRVCLHERDFQPGYGILDNIVHCIDKSRSLIIVVSKKSLKSQWCQFEMHLAQHRFIEARKEQLILVLMDELPRSQRPRTLHYLMATRTFLLWDEKQSDLFWKRLKRVLLMDKSRTVSIV
ncbi:toll-like receptor 13 [Neocloeon triangulifer]|uniref:toll-like receptor 13 n=1 Tax=Neocloeon triangulifer TaxID=2078957 RepID=UPI00286F63BF|nr:toll-like receptor 13 [Neocloeon triangulifer]